MNPTKAAAFNVLLQNLSQKMGLAFGEESGFAAQNMQLQILVRANPVLVYQTFAHYLLQHRAAILDCDETFLVQEISAQELTADNKEPLQLFHRLWAHPHMTPRLKAQIFSTLHKMLKLC